MELDNVIKEVKLNILGFLKRAKLNHFKSVRRLLQSLFILKSIAPSNLKEYSQTLKEFSAIIQQTKNKEFFPEHLECILYILDWANQNEEDELKEIVEKKLKSLKGYYISDYELYNNDSKIKDPCKYEELVFLNLKSIKKLRNNISLRQFYYSLKYRVINNKFTKEIANISIKLLEKKYYIDIIGAFAYFPSGKTRPGTIRPSTATASQKDFWAFRILELIKNAGFSNSFLKKNIDNIANRAIYILESYDDEIDVNLDTYRAVYILYNNKRIIDLKHIKKLIVNYQFFDLSVYNTYQMKRMLNLEWKDILTENGKGTKTNLRKAYEILRFIKENNLLQKKFIEFFMKMFDDLIIKKEFREDIMSENYCSLMKDTPSNDDLLEHAVLSSVYHKISVSREFLKIMEINESTRYMMGYIFSKFLFDECHKCRIFLQSLYQTWEKYPIQYKKMNFFVDEEKLNQYLNDLIQFQHLNSLDNIFIYSESDKHFFYKIKKLFENVQIPYYDPQEYIFDYVVYPNALLKYDMSNNKINGLRMTINFKDYYLQSKVSEIKNIFSNFFNEICSYAEEYEIYEYFGKNNGQEDMILTLKDIYLNENYKYVLKIDIIRCTDTIERSPLKYILSIILPDEFAEIVYNLATNYTLEFEDRRIEPERGIPEGNPISSHLYIMLILINLMLTYEQSSLNKNGDDIVILGYGDDIVILAKDKLKIQEFYTKLKKNFQKIGWKINEKKCIINYPYEESFESSKEFSQLSRFVLVGYEVSLQKNEVIIGLDPERIDRIKLSFCYSILSGMDALYYKQHPNIQKFINVLKGFIEDSEKYPIIGKKSKKPIDEIIQFIKDSFQEIYNIIDLEFWDEISNEMKDYDDVLYFESVFKNLIKRLEENPIFPKRTKFKPQIIIHTDGAADPNPGRAGAGFWILDKINNREYYGKEYLGIKTNNEAEYYALLIALINLKKQKFGLNRKILIKSDSKVMVHHLNGKNYVRDKRLNDLYRKIKNFEKKIQREGGRIEYTHIYGRSNEVADNLSKEAIIEYSLGKRQRYMLRRTDIDDY